MLTPYLHIGVTFIATLILAVVAANLMEGESKIETSVQTLYTVKDPQYLRSMGVLLGPPVFEGNRIAHFENGNEIFPAMLSAIDMAKETISFETFIYWSGEVGQQFAAALSSKAQAGVKVHVLLDWIGSAKVDEEILNQMRQSGVEVERYHKPSWYNIIRLNNRTHRKLLVIDGRVGFTGGVGIADQWKGDAQDPDHWRDSHFRVDGPVAAQMQAVFMDNWMKATGKVLHSGAYFPKLDPAAEVKAQMFSSSPTGGSESMQLMYLLTIAAASKSILLSSSYFVPDELTKKALIAAAQRGVRIRIITPGEYIDTQVVRHASRAGWGDLLKAGIEIYEYQPTMYHVKMMIVDDFLISVGSTNFDSRSFRLNDEANLNIYNTNFAQQMRKVFENDLEKSRQVTFEQWQKRPVTQKIMEWGASLLRHQL